MVTALGAQTERPGRAGPARSLLGDQDLAGRFALLVERFVRIIEPITADRARPMVQRAVGYLSSSPSIEILIGCWTTKGMHLEYKANKRPGNAQHTESNDAVPDIGVSSLKGVGAE